MKDNKCLLADPESTATQGVLDEDIGVATLGWIVSIDKAPDITIPPIHELLEEPTREWWYRKDETEPWFGPLSYRDANSQARKMTVDVDEAKSEVKYAQLGTILGTRGGDPQVDPNMFVAFIIVNGKMTLGGRMAEYHKDKYTE